ncbi:MAG TPA: hypothetical protein VE779_05720 [Candidatus Angelobacter sp.]|nr:hypothetical protein [Candidatus Angelobacter sp.]
MKRTISRWMALMLFGGTVALSSAVASSSPATYKKTVEVTGCLQQAPISREYLLHENDGQTWEVSSADKDMYMNNYVGKTVTISGDKLPPSPALKTIARTDKADAVDGHVRAMDFVVESETCGQ